MPMAARRRSRRSAPGSILAARSTASAIGIMISVVAVFETIMLRIAVAAMKANSSCAGLPPPRLTMASASRRWSPVRSIASAMNAPPRTRNRIGE